MKKRTFIYAPNPSNGANDLKGYLIAQGLSVRRARGRRLILPGNILINWGHRYPFPLHLGVRIINGGLVPMCKLEELLTLDQAGIKVPPFSTVRKEGWLGRRANHVGGSDLLHPPLIPHFWVEKLSIQDEFRVHIMRSPQGELVSIRAGIKVPRGAMPHEWIRSYDGGWKLDYGTLCQEKIRQAIRDAARRAVDALGLDFGAVDVARLIGGETVVLEVNRAPGMEGMTLCIYAAKLRELIEGV